MRLLSACNYSNHAVSKVLHTGEPMVVQPFSPEIEQIFDITGTTVLYMFRPRLPHPQAGMMKFVLRGYKDETLDHLDHVVLVTCILLGVFSKAELEKLSKVKSAHVDVYWKKAWSGLTPKEIAEEKELMKEQRRANYRKAVNNFCNKDPDACLTHAQKKDQRRHSIISLMMIRSHTGSRLDLRRQQLKVEELGRGQLRLKKSAKRRVGKTTKLVVIILHLVLEKAKSIRNQVGIM